MTTFDTHSLLAYSTIQTGSTVIGSTTGVLINVATGDGAKFSINQNVTLWPNANIPILSLSEVVRITAISTDTLTVTRAQEGTTALANIVTGFQVVNGITPKVLTDLETVVNLPYSKRVYTDTFATTLTPNCGTTDLYRVVATANFTLNIPSGTPVDGQVMQVNIIQDSTGGRTIAFGTGYAFSTAIPSPTLTTAANATDVLLFQYSASAGKWRLVGFVAGF
jgi:hypothetical protein